MDYPLAPISVMEPAIIERLRIAFPKKTFTIERVPQTMTMKEFDRVSRLAPFIGLAWTGMRPDNANQRMLKGVMQWRLILIFKASNSLETRFKGDRLGLGLDAMLDVSVVLLQGAEFPGIGFSTVKLANSVIADGFTEDSVVIAQVDFDVTFATTPASFGFKTIEAFKRLGITWMVDDADEPTPSDLLEPQQS